MRHCVIIFSLLLIAMGASPAQAHAFLDHADPAVNATVRTVPPQVTLSFTQNLEPAFSTVQVTGPSGDRIDQGKPQISGNTMRVSIKAAGPGAYHVNWHALSVDTHTTQGSYTFNVGGQ